jgi:hypothetical protein
MDAQSPRRRIKVQIQTRVVTARGEQPVLMIAIGARSALLLAAGPLTRVGETLDVQLPGGLVLTSGVERIDRVEEGFILTVHFMIVEQGMRRALDQVIGDLLSGDGGGERQHPRVRHDIPIAWGENAERPAQLEEISLSGLLMRTASAPGEGASLVISIPDDRGKVRLRLSARVVNQRSAGEGTFHVGVMFISDDAATRSELATMLTELVRG